MKLIIEKDFWEKEMYPVLEPSKCVNIYLL